jgi:hypothetical protein
MMTGRKERPMLYKMVHGLLAAGLLQACAQPQGPTMPVHPAPPHPMPPQHRPPGAMQCHADGARFTLGQAVTPQLAEQARERSGARRVRVIRPGDMVTLEFDPGRLNIELDAAGRVRQVRCG